MTDTPAYVPPKVWTWNKENGGQFASINRPIAGPTHDKELPVGKHPLQLYSLATPNGVKVTLMLEELLALRHRHWCHCQNQVRVQNWVRVQIQARRPGDHSVGPEAVRVVESAVVPAGGPVYFWPWVCETRMSIPCLLRIRHQWCHRVARRCLCR